MHPVSTANVTADRARELGLRGFGSETSDTLAWLDRAHELHSAAGDSEASAIDAHIALAYCLIDTGAMARVTQWLERAATPMPGVVSPDTFWSNIGTVAAGVLGHGVTAQSSAAADWALAQLQPLKEVLTPDECLIAAQVLINFYLLKDQPEMFDVLSTSVGEPRRMPAASVAMQARWQCALGYAHYQVGNTERAEILWDRSLAVCAAATLPQTRLLSSLAMLRLLMDRGRLDEALRLEASIEPEWGAGRDTQLVDLKQMSGRLQLLKGRPVRALATLNEALAIAERAGLGAVELASCSSDLVQHLIANERLSEATAVLGRLVGCHSGRDRDIFQCLLDLLSAWPDGQVDEEARARSLAAGLRRAQAVRYMMFFRLLPWLASELCALALRLGIETAFVNEVIQARTLRAPADADERWPWELWVRMLGTFELRMRGEPYVSGAKVQQKPLELLKALAASRGLALSSAAMADALWPEADAPLAQKSLESAVQRLRRLVGDETLVRVRDGRVSLDPARVSSDVVQRRALIDRMERAAVFARENADSRRQLRQLAARATALSSGELLPGTASAAWLEFERQQCEREHSRIARMMERL